MSRHHPYILLTSEPVENWGCKTSAYRIGWWGYCWCPPSVDRRPAEQPVASCRWSEKAGVGEPGRPAVQTAIPGSPKPPKVSARDPETGQFVSGGGVSGVQYRDHEIQAVRATFRDNGAGSNSAYSLQDVVEVEIPADRRREEAELVALLVHNARSEIDEAEVTDGDGVRAGFEISRDEDIGPLTQFRTEVDLANNASEGDDPGTPLSRQAILDDMDVLWFTMLRGEAGGGGRVNARGGPWYLNYRELTGGGPVFSGGDSLHVHGRQNSIARASNWVADIQFTAVWSVTERE